MSLGTKKSTRKGEIYKEKMPVEELPFGSVNEKGYILIRVPTELRTKFKVWCAKRGYNMTEKLKEVMRDCLRGRIK